MPQREVERDHAAEADAGEMRALGLDVIEQAGQDRGVIGKLGAEHRLRRLALAEHVVGEHAVAALARASRRRPSTGPRSG